MIHRNRVKDEWRKGKTVLGGTRLRRWRTRRTISQDGLAALLGIYSRNARRTVQDWEHGRTRIPDWVRRMIWLIERVEELAVWVEIKGRAEFAKCKYRKRETEWFHPPTEAKSRTPRPAARKYTKRRATLEPGAGKDGLAGDAGHPG